MLTLRQARQNMLTMRYRPSISRQIEGRDAVTLHLKGFSVSLNFWGVFCVCVFFFVGFLLTAGAETASSAV